MLVRKKPPCIFKTEINASHFDLIDDFDRFTEKVFCTYLYFDTKETHELFHARVRLRVKMKAGLTLEVKSKAPGRKFEMAQEIVLEDLQDLLQGIFPKGIIFERFLEEKFPTKIVWVTTGVTIRKKASCAGGIIVLDQTSYGTKNYFSIEFRSRKKVTPEVIQQVKDAFFITSVKKKSKRLLAFENIQKNEYA